MLNQDIGHHILQQVECDFESEGCVEIAYKCFQKWKQRFQEKVSVCNVLDSFSVIGRNDIANAFVDRFSDEGILDISEFDINAGSIKLFVGRDEEIVKVTDFCGNFLKKKLLLVKLVKLDFAYVVYFGLD